MVYDSRARKYLAFCFILFASAIALGAFGAHGLKKVLTPEMLKSFSHRCRVSVLQHFSTFCYNFFNNVKSL